MPAKSTQTRVIILVNSLLLLAGGLAIAGCNSSRSVTAGAVPLSTEATQPSPTEVGPVPGGQPAPAGAADPLIGNPVALQDGRRLFNWYNCSGCHGGHGGGGMGPSLRDQTWIYGDRDDQIFDSIAEGRSKGMPAWGTKIPQDQIWQLVAYIKSMRTPAEPERPVVPPDEQVPNPQHNTPMGVGQHQH
jgi:cytochrome c oxidase cbb3-type subunit 3